MSAGEFIRTFYELDNGGIARARVQPETELMSLKNIVNDGADGPPTVPGSIKVSKTKREFGIGPRKVGIAFGIGDAPTGYESGNVYYVPIMKKDLFDEVLPGDTGVYLTKNVTVVSKVPESIR